MSANAAIWALACGLVRRKVGQPRPSTEARAPETPGRFGSAAARELWLLAILFRADQTHEVNRLSSRLLRVSVPLDKELTLAEVTYLAIKNVEEIFLQGFAPRPGLG
jgi:hypothetical protein